MELDGYAGLVAALAFTAWMLWLRFQCTDSRRPFRERVRMTARNLEEEIRKDSGRDPPKPMEMVGCLIMILLIMGMVWFMKGLAK